MNSKELYSTISNLYWTNVSSLYFVMEKHTFFSAQGHNKAVNASLRSFQYKILNNVL